MPIIIFLLSINLKAAYQFGIHRKALTMVTLKFLIHSNFVMGRGNRSESGEKSLPRYKI